MRILFYTGKGGVGKTTLAAATATHIAKNGKKVLLISSDQAHSLGDSLGCKVFSKPQEISNNFYAMEIDTVEEGKKVWANLHDYLKQIIKNKANYGIEADETLMFPGLDEVFALLKILEICENSQFDVLVVDCAPTGQSLSMLTYAEKIKMIADAVIPMVKNINSIFGNFISKKTSVPKPKEIVFDEFGALVDRLTKLYEILKDSDSTSIRIVTTPEHIVLEEARRNYTWLKLYGFNPDAVYINKIYPEKALDGYFSGWNQYQKESIELAEKSFAKEKIFKLELQQDEVLGKNSLESIASLLYKNSDPLDIFCKSEGVVIEDNYGTRTLIMDLPFVENSDEITVLKDREDIVIRWLNEERRFHLPEKLKKRDITEYVYENGKLKIKMDY